MANEIDAVPSKDSGQLTTIVGSSDIGRYIKEVVKFPILSEKEEVDLFKLYRENGDDSARNKVILSHLRLVVKLALNYKRYNVNLMDLISEGNLGLMHAFKKFDPSKKVRFATYALIWIKSFMQDFIVRSWSTVKSNSSKIKQALFGNSKLLDNSSMESVREISFDSFSNGDSGQDFFSNMALNQDLSQDEKIIEGERVSVVSDAIKDLDPRTRYVLKSRFSEDQKTLDDLSKELSISKERVRQIEEAAIQKIKNKVIHVIK